MVEEEGWAFWRCASGEAREEGRQGQEKGGGREGAQAGLSEHDTTVGE